MDQVLVFPFLIDHKQNLTFSDLPPVLHAYGPMILSNSLYSSTVPCLPAKVVRIKYTKQ